MRVAEKGYAVRREANDLIHVVSKRAGGLIGKAVNQIDVDAVEAEIAGGEKQVARQFVRLNAVDRLLDICLEILNAHAETIEAQLAKSFKMCARSHAGVNLDANLTAGIEMKMLFRESEQILDLLGRQVGWRAATPMELDHRAIFRNAAADAPHLLLQHVEIGRCDALVFLNDDVAGAKEAEAFAEGNMHVERNGSFATFGFFVYALEIGRAEGIVPDRSRGIARIARSGTIVFCEKFFADMELTAHVLEAWMCECHAGHLLPHLRSRPYMVNQRSLAGLDK